MSMDSFSNPMSVANFCRLYDVPKSTVYYLIDKYKDSVLAGHIIKPQNKSQYLDEVAVEFLRPKVKPGENLDDLIRLVRETTEETERNIAKMNSEINVMKADVNSLRAIVNDSRKIVEEKLENAVTKTAVVEDKFSSAENRISALENQIKIFSDRLRKVEEKVDEMSQKRGLFSK